MQSMHRSVKKEAENQGGMGKFITCRRVPDTTKTIEAEIASSSIGETERTGTTQVSYLHETIKVPSLLNCTAVTGSE